MLIMLFTLIGQGIAYIVQIGAIICIAQQWGEIVGMACLFLMILMGYISKFAGMIPATYILPGDESDQDHEFWMVGITIGAMFSTCLMVLIAAYPAFQQGSALLFKGAILTLCVGVLVVAAGWINVKRRLSAPQLP